MAANISANLGTWSTTAASNQPDSTDPADIVSDLQAIQAAVKKYTRTIGANIASASSVDLSAATGDYVHITGTTNITALGTVASGLRFYLEFDGVLTLTHSAGLDLPGGVNITTVAGDVGLFESEGSGNWKCINYQKYAKNINDRAWADVKASRTFDTVYTNTNAYPIEVSVVAYFDGSHQLGLVINSVYVSYWTFTGLVTFATLSGTVPPGGTYSLAAAGGVGSNSIDSWAELS